MLNKFLICMLVIFITCIDTAQAYIDPATGSMAMQVLLGGIAASYLFLRTHITKIFYKIKEILTSKKSKIK